MDTRQDIGQFFNDNLNQMDFTPNEGGWDKIENELNEKKRKKRIIFWMFFGSFLSGCLLTLLLVYSTNFFNPNAESNQNQNDSETIVNSNGILNTNNSNTNSNENNSTGNNSKENNLTNEKTETKYLNGNRNSVVTNENNSINEGRVTKSLKNNNKNNIVAIDNKFKENNISNTSKQNQINRKRKINSNNQINSKKAKGNNLNYTSNHKFSKTKNKNKSRLNQKSRVLAFNKESIQKFDNSTNSNFNSSNLENTNATNFNENLAAENGIKKDSNAVVVAEIVVKDTTALAAIPKKPIKKIEKLLEKDSTEVIAEKKSKALIFAPYYGLGLKSKNQITGSFKSTNDLNITNEHYGFALRWMANKKVGIQIGLGYINASTKTEIEKTNSNNVTFNGIESNSNVTFPPSNKLIMTHDLSMYEIPLEFYYNLNDKKIGFAIAAGISHTIIKNNDVYIESSQEKTKVGSLDPVLDQNFSANLKFYGIYKFSDTLQFEVHPSFQYQFLNTLKNEDLNPYILSFRAGISYKFN